MLLKKTLLAAALIALNGFALNASAASTTNTFQVTATVVNNCIINSTNIAFGNYDPTSATAATAQGSVTARCTKGDVVYVELGQGAHTGTGSTAAVPVRQMASGTNMLPYHIYTTSGGTTEWGAGTANRPASQTSASVGTPLAFVTYGSLPAGTDVPAGSYTDSVVATVTY
jgi:spore coat protein U-like protein